MRDSLHKIAAIALTDIRIEFQDRSTWLFYLVLPLVFTAVLGAAVGGSGGGGKIPLLVVDEDHGPVASYLVSALGASGALDVRTATADDASRRFDAKETALVLTIPAGFGDALLAGTGSDLKTRSGPTDATVYALQQTIRGAVDQVSGAVAVARATTEQAEAIRPFAGQADRQAFERTALADAEAAMSQPVARTVQTKASDAQLIASGFGQSSPGELVTWTLITLLGTSSVFVGERLAGTLRRLLITPTRRSTIILGKVTGRLGLGIIQMALLIGVGALVFHVDWGRSPLALVAVVLAFAVSAVGLGMVIATLARTQAQADGLTILCSMLFAGLGGAWFPLEVTPEGYRAVAQILPTTWAMNGFNDVILRGRDLPAVLPVVGILVGFAAVFFVLASRRLKLD